MDVFSALQKLHENELAAQENELSAKKRRERIRKGMMAFVLSDMFIDAIIDKKIQLVKLHEMAGEYKGDRTVSFEIVYFAIFSPRIIQIEIREGEIWKIYIYPWNLVIYSSEHRKRSDKLLEALEAATISKPNLT